MLLPRKGACFLLGIQYRPRGPKSAACERFNLHITTYCLSHRDWWWCFCRLVSLHTMSHTIYKLNSFFYINHVNATASILHSSIGAGRNLSLEQFQVLLPSLPSISLPSALLSLFSPGIQLHRPGCKHIFLRIFSSQNASHGNLFNRLCAVLQMTVKKKLSSISWP